MRMGPRRQKGVTLVIALIFLAVITFLATSMLGTTSANLKVVGNMQSRGEALDAAQRAIESVISTTRFIGNAADAVPTPCGAANTLCTDLNGDGRPDYITRLEPAPTCVSARIVKVNELSLSSAEDLGCWAEEAGQFGGANGDTLCANTGWEITAETRSTSSRTKVTVTQGLTIRLSTVEAEALCGNLQTGLGERSGSRLSPLIERVSNDLSPPVVTTGRAQRSAMARSGGAAQKKRPVTTQKRRRTYWFVHQDG